MQEEEANRDKQLGNKDSIDMLIKSTTLSKKGKRGDVRGKSGFVIRKHMHIVSWNCKGLGGNNKVETMKHTIHKERFSLV